MRVAIPIWGDKISPVFDTATRLLVVDVDGSENKRMTVSMEGDDLARRCARMKALEVSTLICSAISNPFHRRLLASDIRVIQGISGTAEDVLIAYLHGDLFQEAFLMPGCKRGQKRHCSEDQAERKSCGRKGRGKNKAGSCNLRGSNPKISDNREA